MRTILLDQDTWDLVLDASGNIAVADEPYAAAQDAASAIRLFQGELYYDSSQGVPYFASIFTGVPPPLGLIKYYMQQAAETVPDVASAKMFVTGLQGRELQGQIQLTLTSGTTVVLAGAIAAGSSGGAFTIGISSIGIGSIG